MPAIWYVAPGAVVANTARYLTACFAITVSSQLSLKQTNLGNVIMMSYGTLGKLILKLNGWNSWKALAGSYQ